MELWGTKPGDAFHLLGDHILGEVIMPGQSCRRTGWDEIGSEQSEGPVTGTSGGQKPAIFKFDRAEGQQRGSGDLVDDLKCPLSTLRNRF